MNSAENLKAADCLQKALPLLRNSLNRKSASGKESPDYTTREIYTFLCQVLGLPGFSSLILRWNELFLSPARQRDFFSMVKRRAAGEPVAYILGREKFCGVWFEVSPAVLIPRPETEFMVELFQRRRSENKVSDQRQVHLLDLCCGCGALALTMKRLYPEYVVVGSDICPHAITVSRHNCHQQGLEVSLLQGDLLHSYRPAAFDYILCNPPYLREEEKTQMSADVLNFEPHQALFSAENGLFHIRRVLKGAVSILRPGGELYLEIGDQQAEAVCREGEACGLHFVESCFDFAAKERMLVFCQK